MPRFSLALIATFARASVAVADTAYIEPSDFTPEPGQTITIEVSFNDYCCVPKYPVRSDVYAVILPDGSQVAPDRIEMFATSTVLEQVITAQGTTRFTTGERLGRKGEYVLLNGKYWLVNSDDAEPIDIPDGTPILSSQTATISDAYVTVGIPDWDAILSKIGRLSIVPASHPSKAKVGIPFIARVVFDQRPVSDLAVVVTSEGQRIRRDNLGTTFQTDDTGVFVLTFSEPGVHVVMVRMQAPAPEGSKTDIRSYTTALTLDVGQDG